MTVYENDKGTQWFVDEAFYYHSGWMIYRKTLNRKPVATGYFYFTEKDAQKEFNKMAQRKGWKKVEE